MHDRQEFGKIMVYLASLYPRFELTEATIEAYHDILHDIDTELLKAAARHLGATGTFFPAAAEIRKAAFEIQANAIGVPSAAEAWGEVMREIRRIGSYGSPEFSSELITKAVHGLGGWRMLCLSENNVADRAHFLKIYDAYLQRYQQDAAMLPEIRELVERLSAEMDKPRLTDGELPY